MKDVAVDAYSYVPTIMLYQLLLDCTLLILVVDRRRDGRA